MRKLFTAFFTILLAAGWQWIAIADQAQWIDKSLAWRFGLALTVVLVVQQVYVNISDPISPERAASAARIADDFLLGLLSRYYTYVQSVRPEWQPSVRVNVMLPTSGYKFRRYLRIH